MLGSGGAKGPRSGQVRVPDEAEPRREGGERVEAVLRGEEIFPLVRTVRRGVHERGVTQLGDQRQRGQICPVIVVEPLARPLGGGARVDVEPLEIDEAHDGVLVIARDDRLRLFGYDLDARDGIGAVAHQVSEAERRVGPRRRVGENRLERFEVGVDVRKHRVPHGTAQNVGRSSLWMRSSKPLMNRLDSLVPNFLAISMASLIATFGGTAAVHRSS